MKVYCGGPEVFYEKASYIFSRKKEFLEGAGFEAAIPYLQPGDLPFSSTDIYENCVRLMNESDAGIFNLSPFRGPSADVGTVFELGYMKAQGKTVTGFTRDPKSYLLRVKNDGIQVNDKDQIVDRHGHLIESFGLFDNLMVVRSLDYVSMDPYSELSMFKECVDHLKKLYG